jgi:bifunctional DNA-binding transcriptional regulator/antitoxin component of YhaV-PrlF toxin-antitoxin module
MNRTLPLVRKKAGVHRVLLNKRRQITLPDRALRHLGIHAGEELELVEEKRALVIVPRKRAPKSQAWYYTPEWQRMMREAFEDLKNGRVVGPFNTAEEAIRGLKSAKI